MHYFGRCATGMVVRDRTSSRKERGTPVGWSRRVRSAFRSLDSANDRARRDGFAPKRAAGHSARAHTWAERHGTNRCCRRGVLPRRRSCWRNRDYGTRASRAVRLTTSANATVVPRSVPRRGKPDATSSRSPSSRASRAGTSPPGARSSRPDPRSVFPARCVVP